MILKTNSLPPNLLKIIHNKATEIPYSGKYNDWNQAGSYLCRQCGLALFRSKNKFVATCGWPSFDQEVKDNVAKLLDADGIRTEIVCVRCKAHLGHIFKGENYTSKNVRYCVNSLSLDFVSDLSISDTQEAIFAAGCFWGVEYYFKRLKGVIKTEVGYIGGYVSNPTYNLVCSGKTGHVEAIRVVFDPNIVSYEMVTKYFFEIHNPTQTNGQGPDIGSQYRSIIFYYDKKQKEIAEKLKKILKEKGFNIATQIEPVTTFWVAENYHQGYYDHSGDKPYCHIYTQLFTK